jgi:phage terminase large subunit-like protein
MRQGWFTQSAALNIVERAVTGRNLKWQSPVLRSCLENVTIHTDSVGNRVMHNGKSRDRIDLAVTLWMALAASAGKSNTSIYATDERPDDCCSYELISSRKAGATLPLQ